MLDHFICHSDYDSCCMFYHIYDKPKQREILVCRRCLTFKKVLQRVRNLPPNTYSIEFIHVHKAHHFHCMLCEMDMINFNDCPIHLIKNFASTTPYLSIVNK